MPHEKALHRNVWNEYQMIACLYIYVYIYTSSLHVKIFSKYLLDLEVKQKRKPNVGRGNKLWL